MKIILVSIGTRGDEETLTPWHSNHPGSACIHLQKLLQSHQGKMTFDWGSPNGTPAYTNYLARCWARKFNFRSL